MHGMAGQVRIPGDDAGRIQDRSQPCVAFPKRRFTTPPLGEQRCESERSERGPQHGDLGSDYADGDWLSGVAVATELEAAKVRWQRKHPARRPALTFIGRSFACLWHVSTRSSKVPSTVHDGRWQGGEMLHKLENQAKIQNSALGMKLWRPGECYTVL
jgi:hypothetical protein